jgi:hypothetical protein
MMLSAEVWARPVLSMHDLSLPVYNKYVAFPDGFKDWMERVQLGVGTLGYLSADSW